MDKEQNMLPQEKLSFRHLWQDIKKRRKLYYKVLGITFVASVIFAWSIPNYYKCTVMLAPELSGSRGGGALSGLASSFGVNLGSVSAGGDAIAPTLYPDLMNSVVFRTSLFPITVERNADSTHTRMSYYDYLLNEQKSPWWTAGRKAVIGWIKSLFVDKQQAADDVNPFKLTKKQFGIVKLIEKKVVCDVDERTSVISIDVTDQDPLIAATMADSVQQHLQEFITNYRTQKARVDLDYTRKLYKEAESRYEQARLKYAHYSDANRKVLFENARSEQAKLENEMQIHYRTYSQVAGQLQLAEAKVQQETPVFMTLLPATVPVEKAGPKRVRICLALLLLTFLITTVYVLHKEKHLIPFIMGGDEDEE